jgi:penicillin amidase
VDETSRARLNVGPFPKGGSSYTPNKSTYRPRDFRSFSGPSFRVVIDVGNWDNSRAVNYPGQSGDPRSPHYRDLASMWLSGDYFPLLYSREAVQGAARQWIRLVPLDGLDQPGGP